MVDLAGYLARVGLCSASDKLKRPWQREGTGKVKLRIPSASYVRILSTHTIDRGLKYHCKKR